MMMVQGGETAQMEAPLMVTAVAPASTGVEVGDFFVSSWGYDQTNVDFYKVVGLTPKGVKVQKWSSRTVSDQGPATYVVPGESPATVRRAPDNQEILAACQTCRTYTENEFGPTSIWTYASPSCDEHKDRNVEAPVKTKRLQSYDGGKSVYIPLTSYSSGHKWEGEPAYETGFGWGH